MKRRRFLSLIGQTFGAAAVLSIDQMLRAGTSSEREVLERLRVPSGTAHVDMWTPTVFDPSRVMNEYLIRILRGQAEVVRDIFVLCSGA